MDERETASLGPVGTVVPLGTVADALTGRLLDRRYEVGLPLARGGMATVYVALDRRLDRQVAVKVMHPLLARDPDFVARFEQEAKSAARINHPAVVNVTDAGHDGDTAFLVMELVRGRTLRDLLAERGRLSPTQALELLDPVLSALSAAHAAGLVHRDVKPENVLLADDGAVKVTDFGLARAVEASQLTAGLLLGTVAYLSPEQVSPGRADARSDVYAAGVLLYEMLTGAQPYTGDTPMAVAYRHVHERVPPPSCLVRDVPSELDDLVATATARAPEHRFPDAAAFLSTVRRVRRLLPPAAPAVAHTLVLPRTQPTERLSSPPRPAGAPARTVPPAAVRQRSPQLGRRRRTWLVALLLLLVLSAAAGAGGWWLGSGRYVHVPRLAGLSVTQAADTLRSHHLRPAAGVPEYSDTVGTGLVSAADPGVGARRLRGDQVVLHMSRGVLHRTVPTLTGRSLAAARAALVAQSLASGTISQAYSDTAAVGTVLASDPPAGRSIDHRTPVTLTVSQGPVPVSVPDLSGNDQQEAIATLAGLGLKDQTTTAFSDSVPAGRVVSQVPAPGAAHHGDTVRLVVSKGPQLVVVPKLTGYSGHEARAALVAAGLQPEEFDFFGGSNTVIHQDTPPGSKVRPGTRIRFYTA